MVFYLAIAAIQIFCIVDVIKRGGNTIWIFPLLIAPGISAAAYFIVELLPRLTGSRGAQAAGQKLVKAIDPEREVREARARFEMADTVGNLTALADALAAAGRPEEAVPLYREVVARSPSAHGAAERYARALYELDRNEEALAVVEAIDAPSVTSERDRIGMLRASILADLGRNEEAADLFDDLVTRMPGDEVRCRYAGLLLEMGRAEKARFHLTEVEQRLKQGGKRQRSQNPAMYDWAMAKLAELRR